MARPLRIEYEGAVYHVTSRGNARQDIFLDDEDREGFLGVLSEVVERFNWICHAYCLMSNHYHLLIETPDANLSIGMKLLNSVYTTAFNRRHDQAGHVLQGRFKGILVEKDSYLLELARYVVLNPVRAKMVRHPRHWRWSSYRATAGEITPPRFLTTTWILAQLDEVPDRAVLAYRKFVKEGRGIVVWDDLQGGILLGNTGFVDRLRPLFKDQTAAKEIPRRERLAARPSLDKLFAGTAGNKVARNEKIYEAVRIYEYTLAEVQSFLGLHYSTISIIAKRVSQEKNTKNKDLTPKENTKRILSELPANVTLVAAAKTRAPDEILQVIAAGIGVIGENYVQEAQEAFATIGQRARWHFIGRLQKNKVKRAVEIFDMIETVDSISLAEKIEHHCSKIKKTMSVLIEINSGREPQKAGVLPENAEELIREISSLQHLNVQGLMTMGPRFGDPEQARPYFRETRQLFDRLKMQKLPRVEMKILSMGMSNTYKIAIEEGATMVRIGTKIFGEREYK